MAIKRNKWQSAFEKELTKADKRQISKVKRYYKSEYNKGIESFLAEGQTNFQLLFNTSDLLKIYRDLYSDIGLQFAKWYARNFDKYIEKGVNPNQYVDQWQNSFASYGSAVGAQRVTLVSGTAKKTLVKITQQLLTDIDFQKLGIIEKGRILKSQFNKYSTYQAERLVRTEATNAANFATTESAKTIFPAEQLMKEWIASFDDRTRTTHAEVDGNEVSANDTFMVGGAQMMFPGDPSAPASEVINCRCSVAYFPKANAQATGEITDLNFGLGGGTRTGYGLGDFVADVGATVASVSSSQNIFVPAKSLKEAEERMLNIGGVKNVNLKGLKKDEYNEILKIFEKESRFSKLNLNTIDTYRKSASNARAVYSPSQNRISFNLSKIKKHTKHNFESYQNQILKFEEMINDYKLNYINNSKYNQRQVVSRINSLEQRIKVIKFKIKDGEQARVFSTSSMFEDRIEALGVTFTHEIGHYRHFKQLNETGILGFNKKLSISEYGRTNQKEYFAEWYTYWRLFGDENVPNILLKLFKSL